MGNEIYTPEEKAEVKQKIFGSINENEAIDFLRSLLYLPSENGKPTYAQEMVKLKLKELGFAQESFPCDVDGIKNEIDFCSYPANFISPDSIYNVAGVLEGNGKSPKTFLIHAHIDSSEVSDIMPDTSSKIVDGRLYGLGSADDKGGVAMMLLGAEAVLKICPELNGKLILLSTIGKRGAVGTLTAFKKGYTADGAVYIHPAETGHGFREIKNYSMGMAELEITVFGKAGVFRDEIDDSEINAAEKGGEVMAAIRMWDNERRSRLKFKEGSFVGKPNTKLNIIDAWAAELTREEPLEFHIKIKMYFGLGETVPGVVEELKNYLAEYFRDDEWMTENPPKIEYGEMRATPVCTDRNSEVIKTAESNISLVTGDDNFIYQYHGSSDIRMPIIYGNTPTVGIGPLCGGLNGGNEPEWIDVRDYINGIKIMAGMIVDWCL